MKTTKAKSRKWEKAKATAGGQRADIKASSLFSTQLERGLEVGKRYDITDTTPGYRELYSSVLYLGIDGDESDNVVRVFSMGWTEGGFRCVRLARISDSNFASGLAMVKERNQQ